MITARRANKKNNITIALDSKLFVCFDLSSSWVYLLADELAEDSS